MLNSIFSSSLRQHTITLKQAWTKMRSLNQKHKVKALLSPESLLWNPPKAQWMCFLREKSVFLKDLYQLILDMGVKDILYNKDLTQHCCWMLVLLIIVMLVTLMAFVTRPKRDHNIHVLNDHLVTLKALRTTLNNIMQCLDELCTKDWKLKHVRALPPMGFNY